MTNQELVKELIIELREKIDFKTVKALGYETYAEMFMSEYKKKSSIGQMFMGCLKVKMHEKGMIAA
jgi:hypothetical protein